MIDSTQHRGPSARTVLLFAAALVVTGNRAALARCTRDDECKTGRQCIDGECRRAASCGRDADCPGELVCERSRCTAPPVPGPSIRSAPASSTTDVALPHGASSTFDGEWAAATPAPRPGNKKGACAGCDTGGTGGNALPITLAIAGIASRGRFRGARR